jgi:glutaredoxin
MTHVTLLTQADCAFCDHAKAVLDLVGQDHPLTVEEVSLHSPRGRDLAIRHGVLFAPGILLDGEHFCHGRLSERKLRRILARRGAASSSAANHLEQPPIGRKHQ